MGPWRSSHAGDAIDLLLMAASGGEIKRPRPAATKKQSLTPIFFPAQELVLLRQPRGIADRHPWLPPRAAGSRQLVPPPAGPDSRCVRCSLWRFANGHPRRPALLRVARP